MKLSDLGADAQNFLQGSGGSPSAIEFRAGKCKYQGTTVRPDARKGLVRVQASAEDQLMHLTWTSRVNGVVEDDRIIFPGEATFAYVEQARSNPTNPRVYLLKLAGSNEKMFFWMQEPDASKDEDICKKVNARLNGEEAPAEGGGGDAAGLSGMDQRQLLAMLTGQAGSEGVPPELISALGGDPQEAPASGNAPAASPEAAATASESPAAAPAPAAQPAAAAAAPSSTTAQQPTAEAGGSQPVISSANLASILAGLGGNTGGASGGRNAMAQAQADAMKGASLADVADGAGMVAAIDKLPEEVRKELMSELPEGDRTEAGLKEVLRSAQLKQAFKQLDHVLQSGQGRELLMSMGIPPSEGFENMGPAAVRAFLRGIQKMRDEGSM